VRDRLRGGEREKINGEKRREKEIEGQEGRQKTDNDTRVSELERDRERVRVG
jgi:hypothetical protein